MAFFKKTLCSLAAFMSLGFMSSSFAETIQFNLQDQTELSKQNLFDALNVFINKLRILDGSLAELTVLGVDNHYRGSLVIERNGGNSYITHMDIDALPMHVGGVPYIEYIYGDKEYTPVFSMSADVMNKCDTILNDSYHVVQSNAVLVNSRIEYYLQHHGQDLFRYLLQHSKVNKDFCRI